LEGWEATEVISRDFEFFLADGTRLADMSDEALEGLKGSFGKYMAVLGRTPHYRRKNRSSLDLYRTDMARTDAEQERRRSLNTIELGGWKGYIRHIHPKHVIAVWEADKYKGDYPDDVIACLKIDGKLYICPKDREPSHYVLQDELYELAMDRFGYGRIGAASDTILLPGRIVKRLIHNAGHQKLVDDPLSDSPWTVLDFDPEDSA
jgi:hypothetical protein